MTAEPRDVVIRCEQCRRRGRRTWAGHGPLPSLCIHCLKKNHRNRNAKNQAHRRYLEGLRAGRGMFTCAECGARNRRRKAMGPAPRRCAPCALKAKRNRQATYAQAFRDAVKSGVVGKLKCWTCGELFDKPAGSVKRPRNCPDCAASAPPARPERSAKAAGLSAAVEQADGMARSMSTDRPHPQRPWLTHEYLGSERGRDYLGTLPASRPCKVCRRPVATMRTRPLCLDCLGKGER